MGEKMMAPAGGERLLTVPEVAHRLHMSKQSCYGPLRRVLPWLKVRGSLRMRPADLEAWLDGHRQAA